MSDKEQLKGIMYEDLIFSTALLFFMFYFGYHHWVAERWGMLFGCILVGIFAALWLVIRLYHFTHQDKVFGNQN